MEEETRKAEQELLARQNQELAVIAERQQKLEEDLTNAEDPEGALNDLLMASGEAAFAEHGSSDDWNEEEAQGYVDHIVGDVAYGVDAGEINFEDDWIVDDVAGFIYDSILRY